MTTNNFNLYEHPLFDPASLKIKTCQVKTLFSVVMNWIWCGLPGGYIIGDARMGKSTAIEMNLHKLYNRQKLPIETRWIIIPERDQKSIKATYYCINMALGLGISNSKTTDVLAQHVINYLAELALTSPAKMVVLFVDEFQRLHPPQLQVFAELYDQIRLAKLNLCVIFVANRQESGLLLETIAKKSHSHIRGRFFNQCYDFRGFSHVDEVKFVLKQFDTLRFPLIDGPTYTEYFLSEAYQAGFRYQSLAEPIWRVYYEQYGAKVGLSSWPAQYFFQTINTILTDYLYNEGIDNFNDYMVADAIVNSQMIPAQVIIE